MAIVTVPPRSEVPAEHTWDLASVFPTAQAWEAACEEAHRDLAGLQRFRGRLGEGPGVLGSRPRGSCYTAG
jgi:oligoendopeptidase F